jgi:DNA-binding XRE family transcriptional regulator
MTMRERREALELTQDQLAAELGVTRLTVIRQERRPAIAKLYELALEALETRRGKNPRVSQ